MMSGWMDGNGTQAEGGCTLQEGRARKANQTHATEPDLSLFTRHKARLPPAPAAPMTARCARRAALACAWSARCFWLTLMSSCSPPRLQTASPSGSSLLISARRPPSRVWWSCHSCPSVRLPVVRARGAVQGERAQSRETAPGNETARGTARLAHDSTRRPRPVATGGVKRPAAVHLPDCHTRSNF